MLGEWTRPRRYLLTIVFGLLAGGCASTGVPDQAPVRPLTVAWPVDNLVAIGGYQAKPVGSPTVVDDAPGKSVCLNGKSDYLVLPVNPLHEQAGFSVQLLLKALPGGSKTQTVLHIEEGIGDSRVLFELKATPDGRWMTHGLLRNKIGYEKLEPTVAVAANEWHWLAMTFEKEMLRLFVDGKQAGEIKMLLNPMGPGKLAIGAHQDPKNWFKGCVKELRFANHALPVGQLAAMPPSAPPPASSVPSPAAPPPS